jgi:sugar phosphate isomerase/epimerase
VIQKAVAAQLWTVRSLLGDARGLADALGRIRGIGYPAVQLAGLGHIAPSEIRRSRNGAGVQACSSHEDAEEMLEHPARVAERLHVSGCASVAYPYPKNQDLFSANGVRRLSGALAHAGRVFRAEGILLAYHHHHLEFQRVGRQAAIEIILKQVDPDLLEVELDTCWLQAGGVDPAQWMRRCAGRQTLPHLKDYGVGPTGAPLFREIGAGNLDWDRILPAARRASCRGYIVEQDDHWNGGDPMASLRESWRLLSRMSDDVRSRKPAAERMRM